MVQYQTCHYTYKYGHVQGRDIGLQDTYSVDTLINITCNAIDDLSGIASKECPSVEGPAYTFELGAHKITAPATDKAGNTAKVDIEFTITVDFDSLSRLTQSFVSKDGVAHSLVAKLQSAKEGAVKGNKQTVDGKLKAYENELSAQIGKTITEEQANIFISLSDMLYLK
ncbi:hypothetical protein J7E79_16170 [Bacillus sp. ISL-40]|uniref:hypothetical protein n=1 Tax=unclassified Bacillus (in: firmicutes) TaxID=185979 RepID=UPI001BE77DB5|nr:MULTISPECIES: hypothetical protein [unclassified Bacillus (in: firmicutes)]MBT2698935.1 hypothetical protein [Bacillus sp. ISL-40]MBT2721101.1 hypothetical protein [Bacillus sp. ISL-46]MBT2742665.1 hypothetical protein [Bacillus sp. ISL-77]